MFTPLVELYLDHLRARLALGTYAEHTLADVRRDLLRFASWLSHKRGSVEECRTQDLVAWLAANPQWRAGYTRRRILTTILACFSWLEDERLIKNSPMRRPRGLTFTVRHRREASPVEYIGLMRRGSRPLRRATYFLRNVGCRTCEMRQVRWDDVRWETSTVWLYKHKADRLTGEPRILGLTPRLVRFLRNLHRRRPHDKEIFLNSVGTPWDQHTFARHLRRTAKRIGLDEGVKERVSGYCFRHLAATEAEEAGVPVSDIAAWLGHKDTRMLVIYSKARNKARHLRAVAHKVEVARRSFRKTAR